MSVLDFSDVIYMHASAAILKPLDAIFHSVLRFITGDPYSTHHCTLYSRVGWPSLTARREQNCLIFIYKALLGTLPPYLTSLLNFRTTGLLTRSQSHIRLHLPYTNIELGKTAFSFYAPYRWNKLQDSLKIDRLISLGALKSKLHTTVLGVQTCSCFS